MAMHINNGLAAFLLRLRQQQKTDQDRARCDALFAEIGKKKESQIG